MALMPRCYAARTGLVRLVGRLPVGMGALSDHAQPRTAPNRVVRTIAKHTMKTGFQRSVSGLLLKTKTADTDGRGKLGRGEGLD